MSVWLARPRERREGRPLAVKDLFDTAGLTTTYGSAVFRDHVPQRTASAVARLERAGWAVAGKTNLHEFAYGITSQNPHYGTVPNPTAPGRIAGGSSGGNAAALALGEAEGAIGTDSGGSVRIPAACCGVAGFKPSFGAVSLEGCFPLAPSFDHAGPMARSVAVCAELAGAMGVPLASGSSGSLADLRVALAWSELADPLVRANVEAAAGAFGGFERIELERGEELVSLFMREVAGVHERLFAEHGELYGANVATKVERCLALDDREIDAAAAGRERYRERLAAVFERFDLLITPTLPCVADRADVDELEIRARYVGFTLPFNLVGAPALALPCGPAEQGLPSSVQLVARPGADGLVLAAGELLEAALRSRVVRVQRSTRI